MPLFQTKVFETWPRKKKLLPELVQMIRHAMARIYSLVIIGDLVHTEADLVNGRYR